MYQTQLAKHGLKIIEIERSWQSCRIFASQCSLL